MYYTEHPLSPLLVRSWGITGKSRPCRFLGMEAAPIESLMLALEDLAKVEGFMCSAAQKLQQLVCRMNMKTFRLRGF